MGDSSRPNGPWTRDNIPRLVCISGTTAESVDEVLDQLQATPVNDQFITQTEDLHKRNNDGHNYRGFTVLGASTPIKEVSKKEAKHEVWFVFPGMSCQWAGMGRAFMVLPIFNKAIHRCAAALATVGVDLLDIINNGTEETIQNLLNTAVSIVSIQVAFVDTLTAVGIKPDKIIGHSLGELCCAYADGAFTAEQTVLAAYCRADSVLKSNLIKGSLIVVGLTWEETVKRLPENLYAACHNGKHSVTVSGPEADIDDFIPRLKKEGIFERKAQNCGVAFHSKYVADAGPKFLSSLEKVVPNPKPRSKRWLSSSVPEANWGSELAAYSSAAYHVNNFLGPVYFYDVVKKIPENALVIEIAPHALLHKLLVMNVPKSCTVVGVTKSGLPDELSNFMAVIGKIYLAGQQPDSSEWFKPSNLAGAGNISVTHGNSVADNGSPARSILEAHDKSEQPVLKDNTPRLVCVSGKTAEEVEELLDKLESMPREDDFITQMQDLHMKNIEEHKYRGFTVLGTLPPIKEIREREDKQEVWFVFPGLGAQCVGMCRAFMVLPAFNKAIHRCAVALATVGIDLFNLITYGTEETFEQTLNAVVCIAAFEVGFFDIMTALGIQPDKLVGHSAGEMMTAYADGAFTAEQTVLAAYYRGKSLLDSNLIRGGMALFDLSMEETNKRLPPSMYIACQNDEENLVVVGPEDDVDDFIALLAKDGIPSIKFQTSGVGFHSKYIADAGAKFLESLKKVVPNPKPRSKRWLSTSIQEANWGSELATYSSAAYHVNNFLGPVYFYDVIKKIPENSLVIELAPKAVLRQNLIKVAPKSSVIMTVTKKGLPDELSFFFANIGRMYIAGQHPNLSALRNPNASS